MNSSLFSNRRQSSNQAVQSSAKESAMRLLSRRDHSEHELSQKLSLKGFDHAAIQTALSYCHQYGYLDDLRYALSVVRQGINKNHGERKIRQLLQQNRVDEPLINRALAELDPDWFELAKQLAEKKFNQQTKLEPKERAKRVRFLQSRGFSFEQISYALSSENSME